jgi:uncharacterized protein (TIRG00374 family)
MLGLRRPSSAWLQWIGYAFTAGCLVYVLHGYNFAQLLDAIETLDWKWVALGVAADLSVYVVHAWRWNTLLSPVARLGIWRTVQSIYIGLFANEVLPLRTGEVIRIYLLSHWNNLRFSLGVASAAVERIFDGILMLAAFVVTASFVDGIPRKLEVLVQAIGVVLVLAVLGMVWVVMHKQEAHAVIQESRWAATLRHVIEGLHLMGNRHTMMGTGLISLLYLVLQVVVYWALMRAYGLDLSFWSAGGVVALVRFGTVVPNAPGNIGLFQVACVLALGLFGVKKNDATTFSFVLFCALTLPLLIGGAVATALTGLNIGELRDRAKRGAVVQERGEI